MNHLIDRYLVAVLDRLPESQRQDVGAELRASITDMVEARVAGGEDETTATRAVLTELGDPAKLARSYDQRPQFLIGPTWFPTYLGVLKAVVPTVTIIVATLALVLALVDGDDAGRAIGSAIETAFQLLIQTTFWITLTFALIERFSDDVPEDEEGWKVDDLPKARVERQIGLGTTLFDAIVPVVFGVVTVLQAQRGVGAFVRGVEDRAWLDLPLLNPDLPVGIVAAFFAILLMSLALPIIRYRVGSWTTAMLGLAVAEAAIWIGFTAIVAFGWPIINPEFGREIDPGGSWWETGGDANLVILAVMVVISVFDLWEAWKGHREAQTGAAAQALPA